MSESLKQHFIHLHFGEVVPAMLRRIVVAQTILHQPGPWHDQVRSEARQVTPEVSSHIAKWLFRRVVQKRPSQNFASIAFPANRRNASPAARRDESLWTAVAYKCTDVLSPLPSALSL